MTWRGRSVSAAAILAILAATRWPLAPRDLFSFDAVNFARALEDFNPALHRPQPPGYPLFVGLTRLLNLFVVRPEDVFLLTGILAGAAAALLLWLLADELYGEGAGLSAVFLFLFHPVFWFGGLTNQVRIFLALGGCVTAWFAWHAWQPGSRPRWLYGAAVMLGVSAGFRPSLLLFLFPLVAAAAWRRRSSARELFTAGLLLALAVLPWLGVLVYSVGGPRELWRVLALYSVQQFQNTSMVFGSAPASALKMAGAAAFWNGLGILSWIWVAPFVRRHLPAGMGKTFPFLLFWFVPGFLFFLTIHVGDPDHTLLTVPVICLVGGGIVAAARGAGRGQLWRWALVVAVSVNALLFLRPRPGLHRATSYRTVRAFDRQIHSALERIRQAHTSGRMVLIAYPSFITWRHLGYYFPEETILAVVPDRAGGRTEIWMAGRNEGDPVPIRNGRIVLPPTDKILVTLAPEQVVESRIGAAGTVRQHGPLVTLDAQPGLAVRVAGLTFAVSDRQRSTSGS